ncbi:F-box/kelch-repeat protein At3g61590-like [Zingiber officinale]|uniref:F-box/kelch-repeat protein At3g61590-like n=1 Tax=Zingiber officinale TaxID=94328 RepID=UPI001C4AC55B|nr:F-box/kelch-repeat protein At3g61590-like [Zingiber officinale]
MFFIMEESRKESYPIHHEVAEIRTMPRDSDGEEEEEEGKGTLLSWDANLPDELLQKVLSLLPIANIIKLSIVCKRWYEVVHSCPQLSWAMMAPQKPLFFGSCFIDCAFSGRVYDPCLLRWYDFDFPQLEKSIWRTSSSCGLVCLMNLKEGNLLLVGNPIKRDWKLLPQVPGGSSPHYNALALSFDFRTHGYTVVVAKCTHTVTTGKPCHWHLSVHIYESATQLWATPFDQDISFWMGSDEAVICNNVLYYLMGLYREHPPFLVAFDLAKPPSSIESLIQESIRGPYPLVFARLINLSNKLVMVGVKDNWPPHGGVVILELEDKTWREVAQMPNSVYMTLNSNNSIFSCCGAGDFLFMHSSVWPALLTFDMRQKVWKWSSQMCPCPRPCTEPLQFGSLNYCGFCFEPRLDVSS